MKTFRLAEATQILSHTPHVLTALIEQLPETWLFANEGENTWSPFDVLGHLVHGEKTDWIPRMQKILINPDEPFKPFDRMAQFTDSRGKSPQQLVQEFRRLREANLIILNEQNLKETDFDRKGIHPEFGTVSLQQLLATWVAHDFGHLRQIARVMAKQYAKEVGPWSAYLSVMSE